VKSNTGVMKVCHVLNHSVPHTDGYSVRSAAIVRHQAELGLEPVVVTSPHQEPVPIEPVEVIAGIRYYRVLPSREIRLPVLHELYAMRRLRRRVEEVIREERPDVIHAHSPCIWGCAAERAARRHRLPFVYEVRGLWEDAAVDQGRLRTGALKYRASRALETHVARRAGAVVVIAQGLVREFTGRGVDSRKLFLVPNGVNLEDFSPPCRSDDLKDKLGLNGCLTVGYIGSLYAWEGVDDLIRAVPHVVRHQPQVRFLIVGRGEQEEKLRRLIQDTSVERHVNLVGGVPHDEVARYYSMLDVLVYPRRSSRNTELVTPLKPLEAMAMGKAILASDVAGLAELLGEGSGVFHRAGDPADLAEKCLHLIADRRRRARLGARARQLASSQRDWRATVRTYLDVYALLAKTQEVTG
jgi:glycogen(starch) synthase